MGYNQIFTQMDSEIAVEVVLGKKGRTGPRKADHKLLDLVRVVSKSALELPVAGEGSRQQAPKWGRARLSRAQARRLPGTILIFVL